MVYRTEKVQIHVQLLKSQSKGEVLTTLNEPTVVHLNSIIEC